MTMIEKSYQEMSREELITQIVLLQQQLDQLNHIDQQRRQAEQRFAASEQRYQALTQNIALGLYRRVGGTGGKLVMVNAALVKMFRYESEDELLEVPITALYWDPSECIPFSAKMFKDRQVIREQLKMKRKDGSPIWVAVTATVIRDKASVYFDGIMEDITERKHIAAEKALQQQQLMQADKMITLGILVSGVAHEINNPNQFIASNVSPLQKSFADALPILDRYYQEHGEFLLGGGKYSRRREQIAQMFANIKTGSQRIKGIVDELRDYAREHPTDINETIHINSVLQSALALLANLLKKSTHKFTVSYGENIPGFKGDYQRIEQVLINLIQNACQALPDQESSLSVVSYFDGDRQEIVVEITDSGVGIAPEDLKHLKDPFFTTKRSQGGTGLGLSISGAIVDKHQGRLEFESDLGKGTCARLSLPALREDSL